MAEGLYLPSAPRLKRLISWSRAVLAGPRAGIGGRFRVWMRAREGDLERLARSIERSFAVGCLGFWNWSVSGVAIRAAARPLAKRGSMGIEL